MGCDGGTIPRRDELVRLKKKPEQKDKDAERFYRWRHCALTQQKLQEPIVICGLGRLYNKQAVIEHLLEKEKMPESCAHIKSLKDIRNLNLTPNPAFASDDIEEKGAPYICSLIGLEMSGKFRFVALWSCGCVFSERALIELKTSICSMCLKPYTESDVVILNGNEEDISAMQVKMEARVARFKAEKKDKKDKSSKVKTEVAETITKPQISGDPSTSIKKMITLEMKTPSTSSTPAASTSSGSSKSVTKASLVADPVSKVNKRALISDKITGDFKKSKQEYSVAKDENATEIYKSLFTSHENEATQGRAHWITMNPYYN